MTADLNPMQPVGTVVETVFGAATAGGPCPTPAILAPHKSPGVVVHPGTPTFKAARDGDPTHPLPADAPRSRPASPRTSSAGLGLRTPFIGPANPGGCRAALFIDLDNVTITDSQQSASDEVEDLLQRIVLAAGPVDWKIAVAPSRTITDFGPSLAKLNLRWQVVPCSPDAADARIVSLAGDLHRCGFQRYIIASADGYFADLREFGHLTVIARSGKPTSLRLRAAADELIAA